jgi:hypothetical protein
MSKNIQDLKDCIRDVDRWILWKKEDKDGKTTKIPIDENGVPIDATDRENWKSHSGVEKEQASKQKYGKGFVFSDSDNILGIDLDDVRDPETDEIEDWAEDVINRVDALWEVSPSGTGFHGYTVAQLPQNSYQMLDQDDERTGHMEIYQTNRFFTYTDDTVKTPVSPRSDDTSVIREIIEEFNDEVEESDSDEKREEYDLDIDCHDILFRGDYPAEKRVSHPYHDSSTNSNFKIDEDLETWRCWRHSTTGNPLHLIGMEEGIISCGEWDDGLSDSKWRRVLRVAEEEYGVDLGDENDTKIRERDGRYYILDGETEREISSFTMELQSLLEIDGEEWLNILIKPVKEVQDEYEVQVSPKVFNERRDFKEEICTKRTVNYTGSTNDLAELEEHVLSSRVQKRKGTKKIGIQNDEFVTPDKTFTNKDGVQKKYVRNGSSLEKEFSVDIDEEVDEDGVAETLELLQLIRPKKRHIPIISWWYSMLFAREIREIEGEIPLLMVKGESGSGKTALLKKYKAMWGMAEEPGTLGDTNFALNGRLSASDTIPAWIDEFKPSELQDHKIDSVSAILRRVTSKSTRASGNADMSVDLTEIGRPTCISGEEMIRGSAEQRRSIATKLKRSTVNDWDRKRYWSRLTGETYENGDGKIEHNDGKSLSHHARYIYDYAISKDRQSRKEGWKKAKTKTYEILRDLSEKTDNSYENLGGMEITKLTTMVFGSAIFKELCSEVGAEVYITEDDIVESIEYVAEQVVGENREKDLQEWFSMVKTVAEDGRLDYDKHFKYKRNERDQPLCIDMRKTHHEIRRYMKENNVSGYDIFDRADPYRDIIEDKQYHIKQKVDAVINTCQEIDEELLEEEIDGWIKLHENQQVNIDSELKTDFNEHLDEEAVE